MKHFDLQGLEISRGHEVCDVIIRSSIFCSMDPDCRPPAFVFFICREMPAARILGVGLVLAGAGGVLSQQHARVWFAAHMCSAFAARFAAKRRAD